MDFPFHAGNGTMESVLTGRPCRDTLSQRRGHGGEAMSRREIYRRTKGYSIYGVAIAALFMMELLVVIIIGVRTGPIDMWENAIFYLGLV